MRHLQKFESFDHKINEEVITLISAGVGAVSLFTALLALYNRSIYQNSPNREQLNDKINDLRHKLRKKGIESDAKIWIDRNIITDSEFRSKLQNLKRQVSGGNFAPEDSTELNILIQDLKSSMDQKLEPLLKTRPELYMVIKDELEKI